MMKGIAAMVMSRVVMAVFLFTTFSIIIAFLQVTAERGFADASGVLAMQIRDAISGMVAGASLYGQQVIPLPRSLPEITEPRAQKYSKSYTLGMYETPEKVLAIAVAAGDYADINDVPSYTSAFSLETAMTVILPAAKVARPSKAESWDVFLVIKRFKSQLCLIPCNSTNIAACVGAFPGCK
jgi:hypothetical protein